MSCHFISSPSMRTRNRTLVINSNTHRYPNGTLDTYQGSVICESITESRRPGGHNVVHWKQSPANGVYRVRSGGNYTLINHISPLPPVSVPSAFRGPTNQLNWGKLPSSSDFGLVQFFAELDDTIASFSTKFVKSLFDLRRGSAALAWQFGALPIVNDVIALSETLGKVTVAAEALEAIVYEDTFRLEPQSYSERPNGPVCIFDSPLSISYSGRLDMGSYKFDMFLDSIGFHPSVAAAWSVVPLSFLVDQVIPIGQFLDSFHNGGWIRTVPFRGWRSMKYKGGYGTIWKFGDDGEYRGPNGNFRYYSRQYVTDILEVHTDPGFPPNVRYNPETGDYESRRPSIMSLINALLILWGIRSSKAGM